MNKEDIDQVSDVKVDCLEPKLDTERPHLANRVLAQPGTTMENYYFFFTFDKSLGFLIISQQFFEVGFLWCFKDQLRSFEGFLEKLTEL